jgi:hypothetical protein
MKTTAWSSVAMVKCVGCEKKFLHGDHVYFVYFVDGERVHPVVGALVGGPLCYQCYWGEPPIAGEGDDAGVIDDQYG